MSYKIHSNISEKQVEADVSSFFGWISRGTPFRLLDVDEQLTGADKKFYDSGFCFFMQFKVSNGLEAVSKVPLSNRKNRSKLEDIREFRNSKGLGDDPTLYFQLRAKANTAIDYQHNILLNHANKSHSQAFYVAPLHLDKNMYYDCLFDTVNRYRHRPYYYFKTRMYEFDWVSHVGFIPFLKEHVSIIPHVSVNTHEHYYSYSSTGCDIGWHSPQILSEKPSRLSDMLSKTILNCIENNNFLSLYDLDKSIEIPYNELYESEKKEDNEPLHSLKRKGELLYKYNAIKMVLLLTNKEILGIHKNEFQK